MQQTADQQMAEEYNLINNTTRSELTTGSISSGTNSTASSINSTGCYSLASRSNGQPNNIEHSIIRFVIPATIYTNKQLVNDSICIPKLSSDLRYTNSIVVRLKS